MEIAQTPSRLPMVRFAHHLHYYEKGVRMGWKPRSQFPRKITALLKVGVGAADAEYARAIMHWHFLFGAHRPRITFKKGSKESSFKIQVLKGQAMRKGESYLIIQETTGTFIGVIVGGHARAFGGQRPEPGRFYHLIRMAKA